MLAFSIAIAILTATTATAAFWAIADSWCRYGKAALALRGALRECPAEQAVRFTIREIEVRPASAQPVFAQGAAAILWPSFRVRPARPATRHAWRAAA